MGKKQKELKDRLTEVEQKICAANTRLTNLQVDIRRIIGILNTSHEEEPMSAEKLFAIFSFLTVWLGIILIAVYQYILLFQ